MSDNSEVTSRVYKVGYALTSYQECPICKNHIQKNSLNIINERVIKYRVSHKIVKSFYHFQCYDLNSFKMNDNKFSDIEQIEGYTELNESDKKQFKSLINSHISKLKAHPNEKVLQKLSKESIQHQQTLKEYKLQNIISGNGNQLKKEGNINSRNGESSNHTKTQTSLLDYAQQKIDSISDLNSHDRNFHHTSNLPEQPMKQQTLNFKTNKNGQLGFKEIQNNVKQEVKSLQQKIESFQFDKNQNKFNKQPKQIQKNELKTSIQIDESSEEEYFQPSSLNTKRSFLSMNDNACSKSSIQSDKIVTTSEKLQQLKLSKQQKDNQNIKKDPKIKKRKLNNSDSEQQQEKTRLDKKQVEFQQLNFDEYDSDYESRESSVQQKMIAEDKIEIFDNKDNYIEKQGEQKYNGKIDNYLISTEEYKYNPSKIKKITENSLNLMSNKPKIDIVKKSKINRIYIDSDDEEEEDLKKANNALKQFEYNKFDYLKQNKNQMEDEQESINESQMLTQQGKGKVQLIKRYSKLSTDQTQSQQKMESDSIQKNNDENIIRNSISQLTFKQPNKINSEKTNNINQVTNQMSSDNTKTKLKFGSSNQLNRTNSQNDRLLNTYSKDELINLLEKNGYKNIRGLNQQWLKCIAADGMSKGALPQCAKCVFGQLIYNEIKDEYFCGGSTTTKCSQLYSPSEVFRKTWVY